MKRTGWLAVVALAAALAGPVQATGGGTQRDAAEALRIEAAAWYLVASDGAVLAAERARQRRAIASITKLMTAVVAIEGASLSDVVTVGRRAPVPGESTAFLRPGERLTVAELVRALLVPSANDAAEALARHVGGGSVASFVSLMNDKAAELGLADTSFSNPHGLDAPGHLSSARDATLLVRYALGIPFIRDALGRQSVMLSGGRDLRSTDDLLGEWKPFLGGKTGHTAAAGWSQAGGARTRGVTVYGVVLGSGSRTARNAALRTLLSYGLAQYRRVATIDSSRVYAEARTSFDGPSVELVATTTVMRTLRNGTSLVERVVAPDLLERPVTEGQRVGTVQIWLDNELLASSPLVAADGVAEPGVARKALWYAQETAENLWEIVT